MLRASCLKLEIKGILVYIEDCGGWWLSGCRSSVAEHWRLKPGVLGSTPGGCWPFSLSSISPHNILKFFYYWILTTTSCYRGHSAIVQHNTNFATVHSRVTVGGCSVEYEYKLSHQFAHVVAHRMPYTYLFIRHRCRATRSVFEKFFQFAVVCLQSYWVPIF